jgi:hypothetical protein
VSFLLGIFELEKYDFDTFKGFCQKNGPHSPHLKKKIELPDFYNRF